MSRYTDKVALAKTVITLVLIISVIVLSFIYPLDIMGIIGWILAVSTTVLVMKILFDNFYELFVILGRKKKLTEKQKKIVDSL